jgi:hypothetical protein
LSYELTKLFYTKLFISLIIMIIIYHKWLFISLTYMIILLIYFSWLITLWLHMSFVIEWIVLFLVLTFLDHVFTLFLFFTFTIKFIYLLDLLDLTYITLSNSLDIVTDLFLDLRIWKLILFILMTFPGWSLHLLFWDLIYRELSE